MATDTPGVNGGKPGEVKRSTITVSQGFYFWIYADWKLWEQLGKINISVLAINCQNVTKNGKESQSLI